MVTYQQLQQQIVTYNQGYYGQLLEASQGYQEENNLENISKKVQEIIVKNDSEVTKWLKEIEEILLK